MAKVLKKISFSLIGIVAFLIAGVFFVGCGVDYSKISIKASVDSIELNVGQSADLIFTIDGFQKGFSNEIQVDIKNSGQTQILQYDEEDLKYKSDTEILVKVTGKAGGIGTIVARTLEGNKQCEVAVSVNQDSHSMKFDDSVLYVSNSTPFVLNSDYFIFDANTTNKSLTYYYIEKINDELDYNLSQLVEIGQEFAKFSDGKTVFECNIVEIDEVRLPPKDDVAVQNKISLLKNGQNVTPEGMKLINKFEVLAVYNPSIDDGLEEDDNFIYDVATVNVLPDIEVKITGGYYDNASAANDGFGYVTFVDNFTDKNAQDGDGNSIYKDDSILIVPNNSKKNRYLLKVEMSGSIEGADIEIEKLQDNNFIDVDFVNYEEIGGQKASGVVYYLKLSHNSQYQAQTVFALNVFYDIAQGISDESVNSRSNFLSEIQIAPNAITVNGTTTPDALTLYNYYKYPEFGWRELLVDVVSGFDSSANFEGVYVEFDDDYLDVLYKGVSVGSGEAYLYKDLSEPFYVRGKYGAIPNTSVGLKVYAKSAILEKELDPVTVVCDIIPGATNVSVDEKYYVEGVPSSEFYIDFDAGRSNFNAQVYANQKFQSITYKLLAGADVVNIGLSKDGAYIRDVCDALNSFDDRYYLNIELMPKIEGTGLYRVFLDNGISIDLTFNVIKVLTAETTTIKLADSGNDAVTSFERSRQDTATYDDVINIDILNSSDRNNIYYGSYAFVEVLANAEIVRCVVGDGADVVSVSKIGERYRLTTLSNGNAQLLLTVSGAKVGQNETADGEKVCNFKSETVNLVYTINVCSYSLVNEYYLKNGDDFAIDNEVYYGPNVQKTDRQVKFSAYVNKVESKNFYAYQFADWAAELIFETNLTPQDSGEYSHSVENDQIEMVLRKTGAYDKKYIYFFAQRPNGAMQTMLRAKIVKRSDSGFEEKIFKLSFGNGLMFMPEDFSYATKDENDKDVEYFVTFDNAVYTLGSNIATFDVSTFVFEYVSPVASSGGITLQSNLRQPNQTKKYNAKISTLEFKSVEGISLATNLTNLDFANNKLVYEIGVFTYPADATNKNIRVEFVRTNNNEFADMVKWDIDTSQKDSGLYTIRLSCEDFYEKNQDKIVNIVGYLTGKIYIYPADWGDSYTNINLSRKPIELEVQYRNGSKANPYLIENAEDVLAINSSAITLMSHYEIGTVIDMSTAAAATPIGLLADSNGNLELVGFSGSIVGSNSQAAISNIEISNENFCGVAGGVAYYGLFAQLNREAELQNIQFSGSIDVIAEKDKNNISLIASVNKGFMINVGAKVSGGAINAKAKSVVFGAAAAVNEGGIVQDFSKLDGTEKTYVRFDLSQVKNGINRVISEENPQPLPDYYVENVVGAKTEYVEVDQFGYKLDEFEKRVVRSKDEKSFRDFSGQSSRNLAFYNDFIVIDCYAGGSVVAGGVVGLSNGLVQTIAAVKDYKVYGYGEYAAFTLLKMKDNASAEEICLGGVAGQMAGVSNKDSYYFENQADGLLVGGEVSVQFKEGVNDYVGGIVGYVDTKNKGVINVTNNTSRVFVRANQFVGAVVGYEESAKGSYGDGKNVVYGQDNLVQAVDDGQRGIVASAMMIRYSNGDYAVDSANVETIAIGNSKDKKYQNNEVAFVLESYLQRNDLLGGKDANDEEINLVKAGTADYYGDYLIVTKNQKGNFVLNKAIKFTRKEVDLEFKETGFEMFTENEEAKSLHVYMMKYFRVNQSLNGDSESGEGVVENLNIHNPNGEYYPFKLGNNSVNIIAASSNIMEIDVNGVIKLKGTGLATIEMTSILNAQVKRTVYVFITNYFDKEVVGSIFYTSRSSSGANVPSGATVTVYGSSATSISLVPNYKLIAGHTFISETDMFSISESGVLRYRGVDYELQENSNLTVAYEKDSTFSGIQINKQTVVFFKETNGAVAEGAVDEYKLVPILRANVLTSDGKSYEFYYKINGNNPVELNVNYKETASSIRTQYNFHSMHTNNFFREKVYVSSENENEMLFYQIVRRVGDYEEIVQERLPMSVAVLPNNFEQWKDFIRPTDTSKDLFDVYISRSISNQFELLVQVNADGEPYSKRFEKDIYGEYIVRLFANELEQGVSTSFRLLLNESEINYLSISNFSSINDIEKSNKIIPTQTGLLEIVVDPADAVFERMTISNNAQNYLEGATEASIAFVYKSEGEETVEYVEAPNFGVFKNGKFEFSYQDMIEYYKQLEETGVSVKYDGKVYVSYFMPSKNVDDGVLVGFDVEVVSANEKTCKSTISLRTKLKNYAKLLFADKAEHDGIYFVAKGLSYNMNMSSYGFTQEEISVEVKSADIGIASISKVGNGYVLQISSKNINYNGTEKGYKIQIITRASKVVDNVVVETEDVLDVYVMEYVVNYHYIEGINEDIVKGMEDGVITTAIGNPYDLEFAIRDFLEYDQNDEVVNAEVETFVKEMTNNISWKVYYQKEETALAQGKIIKDDYYYINSYTVTPLKIYNAASDIYHFSAGAYYTMNSGRYAYSADAAGAYRVYTEFSFEVHNQSTQDSPLPIETYQDLMNMKDGEYYILLKDIVLPSDEAVLGNEVTQFMPMNKKIKGLDGNGYSIMFSGTYNFFGVSRVGLFDTVEDGVLVKNITISLKNVTFRMDSPTFRIGLLAASNKGVITNCQVQSIVSGGKRTSLAVSSLVTTTDAYIGGLVGENSGDITHSRSKVNIISNVNMAGLVAINSGKIASSYYKEGYLINQTNTTNEFTAGLVVTNSGEIYTSYVSGAGTTDPVYYNGEADYLQSSNNLAGFVYSNSGEISDCYSNIKIKQSGKVAAGFVYENTGIVNKCFSTSVLESNKTSNYGFARTNKESGKISYCYFLSDGDEEHQGANPVNINISTVNNDENVSIEPLTIAKFGSEYLEKNFSEFAYVEGRGADSVWFYNEDGLGDANMFGAEKSFNLNRLELVAPNVEAYSRRELYSIENVVDKDTGATYVRYIYIYASDANALGSFYNPITITSAEEMENYILQETNSAGYNYSNYRFVKDVDYSNYLYNSKLFKTKFVGYLEGNFMEVSGINLLSSDKMSFAGLFAEVGSSTIFDAKGTLLNFDFEPAIVSFSNTSVVGGLVGKVDAGNVVNVTVNQNADLVVVGNNIVGGAIGLAVGNYCIENVYSNLNAKARNQKDSMAENDEGSGEDGSAAGTTFNESSSYSEYSIAGTVVGALAGRGSLYNVTINADDKNSVLARRAGLVAGYVGNNVRVAKVLVEMNNEMRINAYDGYGGLVFGETRGMIENVRVIGTGAEFENFKKLPYTPTAVGGFAGKIGGGLIKDVEVSQSIKTAMESDGAGIEGVGGIAGKVTGAAVLEDVLVEDATLVGYQFVGGLIGYIDDNAGVVSATNVSAINCQIKVFGRKQAEGAAAGGFVGCVGSSSSITLSQHVSLSKIDYIPLLKDFDDDVDAGFDAAGLLEAVQFFIDSTDIENQKTEQHYCSVLGDFEGKNKDGLQQLLINAGVLSQELKLATPKKDEDGKVTGWDIADKESLASAKTILEREVVPKLAQQEYKEKFAREIFKFYNVFDFTVDMTSYVYDSSSDFEANVGAVVGVARYGSASSLIMDCYTSVTGTCRVYSMTATTQTKTFNAAVVKNEDGQTFGISNGVGQEVSSIKLTPIVSGRSYSDFNVTFLTSGVTTDGEIDSGKELYLSYVGIAYGGII